jgi:ATP synthase protein I
MNSEPPREQRRMAFLRQFALAMDLPFILVGGILIGGGLGYLLDRWLHTSPFLALALGAAGFAGGMWEVLRTLSRAGREKEKEKRDDRG